MQKVWVTLSVVAFLLFPKNLWGSSGTEGAAFLDIPVGAGPAAMGSAYTALAADAYAPVYNPAGLGFLPNTQVAAQHLSYLESIHYEYLSGVHPIRPGKALGISAQYLGSGDIGGTDPNGTSTGDYSDHYGAYSLAYGQKITDTLALGLTGKWIHANLADVSANAYAVDLGSLYQVKNNLSLALTLTNLGSPLEFVSQSDALPRALHIGAAYAPNQRWTLSGEGVHSFSGLTSGRLGMEWKPIEMIGLRAGYKTETTKELSSLAGLTIGAGVKVWGHELAYAWLPYGDLGDSQYISLVMHFGAADERQRNLIQIKSVKSRGVDKDGKSLEDPAGSDVQLMELLTEDKERDARAPGPARPARKN